jgi:hypothetical protein
VTLPPTDAEGDARSDMQSPSPAPSPQTGCDATPGANTAEPESPEQDGS